MEVTRTHRGFELAEWPAYPTEVPKRLVQASSAIGEYEDAMSRPGTSFLWVGADHHLNRDQVRELIAHLQAWLDTGSLRTFPTHARATESP